MRILPTFLGLGLYVFDLKKRIRPKTRIEFDNYSRKGYPAAGLYESMMRPWRNNLHDETEAGLLPIMGDRKL